MPEFAPRRLAWPSWLPQGYPLTPAKWQRRHRVIGLLAWSHVPLLLAAGPALDASWGATTLMAAAVAAFAGLATLPSARLPTASERTVRSCLAGTSLMVASAGFIHLSGGLLEMHFHVFIALGVVALYEDWWPFATAITVTVADHALVAAIEPGLLFAAHGHAPFAWAGLHAFFVAAAAVAAALAWRFSELGRIAEDRSSHRLAETWAQHRATLDATADGILAVDREGRITSCNEQYARLWGVPPHILAHGLADQAVAWTLPLLKEPDAFAARWRELATDPEAESHGAFELIDGRVVESDSRPQRKDGHVIGRVWCFRDVTARRRAERDRLLASERLAQIKRLEEISRLKTQLLNITSHELNTPLTPLRLQLHLLQQPATGELNDRQRRAVQVLDRNLERLAALVQNVLDVARLQGDRLRLNTADVAVEPLVADVLEAFGQAARNTGVRLGAEGLAPDLAVRGDQARLTQVLFNLLSNALRFTPAGGKVSVKVTADDARVHVGVTDTGRGLDPGEMAQLFLPYSQVHDAEGPQGGTGLGLFICKGIIEAHGGTVGVASDGRGKGSTFWFTLPRVALVRVVAPEPEPHVHRSGRRVRAQAAT